MNHSAGFVCLLLLNVLACEQESRPRTSFNPPPSREVLPVRTNPPEVKSTFESAGSLVAGSEKCRDCEFTYAVHDGKGGQMRRSKNISEKCCPCGSTQKFRDGNQYQIRCENGRIIARMR